MLIVCIREGLLQKYEFFSTSNATYFEIYKSFINCFLFACSYVCLVFVFYVLFSFLTWDKCASEGAKKQQMKVSEWSMKFAWVQVTESEMSSGRSVLLFLKGWVNVWASKYVTLWGGKLHKKLRNFLRKKVPCPSFPVSSVKDCQSTSVCYIEFVLLALHTLGEMHWNSLLHKYLRCLLSRP